MQAETSERREHRASIDARRSILQAFASAVNHAMPFASLGFIAIPFVIFGMFSMGLNPEDSQLRLGYYLVVTAVPALSIMLGFVIGMIKWRRGVRVVLSFIIGLVAFACYLWFYARVSIVATEPQSQFVGWHWSSRYQYFLLLAYIMLLSLRCGMTFKRTKSIKNRDEKPELLDLAEHSSKISGVAIALSIIAAQYLASWLAGWWYMLFLLQACIEVAGSIFAIWTPGASEQDIGEMAGRSMEHAPLHLQALIIASIPFMLLAQGFDLGLVYIANNWTSAWLASFAWTFGFASLTFLISVFLQLLYPKKSILPPMLFISACLMLALFLAVETRLFMPMDIACWLASGIAAGMLASGISSMLPARRHPFRATIHVMLTILFISLGIGIGIAFYLYEPYGDEYIALAIPVFEIIAIASIGIQMIISRALIKKKSIPVTS